LAGDEATGRAAAEYTAAALRIYQDLFGPYPYNELVVVAGPLTFRGMEYPGLFELGVDLYRQNADELEFRVAHEVAHQWWYNLVGNDPVNMPWLDEGLAEFATYFYTLHTAGQARADALAVQRWQAPYAAVRNMGLDAATNQPVEAYQASNYETIIYGKAALFHNELRQAMGEERYLDMLRAYIARHRFGIATSEDLLALVEEYGGAKAKDLYRQWIVEANTEPRPSEPAAGDPSS
jgi:aminopeptidase N